MNPTAKFLGAICAILLFTGLAFGQATMSETTTGAAVALNDGYVYVAATTGMSAGNLLYIDNEVITVLSVDSTTRVKVRRSSANRRAAHVSGARVYFGTPDQFGASDPPLGACTATEQPVLPLVVPTTKNVWNCLGSPATWQVINGPSAYNAGVTVLTPGSAGAVDIGALDNAFRTAYLTSSINFEGATANGFETTVTATDPTADRTVTIPDAAQTVGERNVSYMQGPTVANAVTTQFFIADRAYTITAVKAVWGTAESTGAMDIKPAKATGTEACSATAKFLTTAAFDGTGAANTVGSGTLTATAADLALAAGDRLCVVLSATPNEVKDIVVTVAMIPK